MSQIATAIYAFIFFNSDGWIVKNIKKKKKKKKIFLKFWFYENLELGKFGNHDFLGTVALDKHLHKKIQKIKGFIKLLIY